MSGAGLLTAGIGEKTSVLDVTTQYQHRFADRCSTVFSVGKGSRQTLFGNTSVEDLQCFKSDTCRKGQVTKYELGLRTDLLHNV